MSEYEDLISDFDNVAPTKAITSLDQNPDQGARALSLSRSTGVDPEIIHGDLPGFEQEHKQALTNGIVRNNDYIAAYIRGNKLADVVSNDDYGNLDNVSSVSQRLSDGIQASKDFIKYLPGFQILKGGFESFEAPMLRTEDVSQDGLAGALVRSADVIAKTGRAVMAAPMVGIPGWVNQVVLGLSGGDANLANSLSREVAGMMEEYMGRGGSGMPHEVSNLNTYLLNLPREQRAPALEQITKWKEASTAAEPWTKAGLEPPRGVHPLIDELKVKGNEENIAWIDEVLSKAQESLTKERDPQLFENFIEQHVGDSTIGISADRIAALYGDKIPEAGDNLFGWLPGMAEKLEAAKTFGEDVQVPLKDWLTKVDPQLAKDLHDDVRTWPGAITKNEAKLDFEPRPVVDAPLAQVRDAMATEPVFSIGDRKLTLAEMTKLADTGGGESHAYKFVDQNGKDVGQLWVSPDSATKQLHVDMINGVSGFYANSFGPSLIRDIKRQLKEMYPEYETITGHRVSGARYSPEMIRQEVDRLARKDGLDPKTLSQAEFEGYYV